MVWGLSLVWNSGSSFDCSKSGTDQLSLYETMVGGMVDWMGCLCIFSDKDVQVKVLQEIAFGNS
jgi:hypothetical protein|tara:strand:- start:1766 stop:1957 length:192 start_codon:yes stop_codon:yes gene_type:complete